MKKNEERVFRSASFMIKNGISEAIVTKLQILKSKIQSDEDKKRHQQKIRATQPTKS